MTAKLPNAWKRKFANAGKPKESAAAKALRLEVERDKREALEREFAVQIRATRLPEPRRQFMFHPVRKWHADFAWPSMKLIVEIDGGTWSGGRHVRGKGYEEDRERDAEANMLGYTVIRFTSTQVHSGYAIRATEKMITSILTIGQMQHDR